MSSLGSQDSYCPICNRHVGFLNLWQVAFKHKEFSCHYCHALLRPQKIKIYHLARHMPLAPFIYSFQKMWEVQKLHIYYPFLLYLLLIAVAFYSYLYWNHVPLDVVEEGEKGAAQAYLPKKYIDLESHCPSCNIRLSRKYFWLNIFGSKLFHCPNCHAEIACAGPTLPLWFFSVSLAPFLYALASYHYQDITIFLSGGLFLISLLYFSLLMITMRYFSVCGEDCERKKYEDISAAL